MKARFLLRDGTSVEREVKVPLPKNILVPDGRGMPVKWYEVKEPQPYPHVYGNPPIFPVLRFVLKEVVDGMAVYEQEKGK